MKQFLYLIICIVILSLGSLFVLKKPNGQPWLNLSDFYNHQSVTQKVTNFKDTVVNKTNSLLNQESNLLNSGEDPTIYKWQDEQGIWHYSDKKFENAKAWEKPENLTIIPAIQPIDKNEYKRVKPSGNNENETLVPPQSNKIKDLINNANNVQNIMDNRTKNIDEQLKQIQ